MTQGPLPIRLTLLLVVVLCLLAVAAPADRIEMHNGMLLAGRLVAETDDAFTLEIDGAPFVVAKKDAARVERAGVWHTVEASAAPLFSDLVRKPEPPPPAPKVEDTARRPSAAKQAAPPDEGPAAAEVTGATYGLEASLWPLLPPALPPGRAVKVNADSVRMRAGPGTTFEPLTYVHRGEILTQLEREDEWLRCEGAGGTVGWIVSDYVDPMEETLLLVAGQRVNLRERPGTQYRSVGRMEKGSVVAAVGENADWKRVRTPAGRVGWAHGPLLVPSPADEVLHPRLRLCEAPELARPSVRVAERDGVKVLEITTEEDEFVRSGRAGFVLLTTEGDRAPTGDETIFQRHPTIQWYTVAKNSGMLRRLGFESAGSEGVRSATALHVAGEWLDRGAWAFSLPVRDPSREVVGIVVQEGPRRGCVVRLQTMPK